MKFANASSANLFFIVIFVSYAFISNPWIFLTSALSFVSTMTFEQTSEYIFANPYEFDSIPAACMYFAAGPLIDFSPINGLTAITFFLIFYNSFLIPFSCNIGPIDVSGFPGAKITMSAS